MMEHDRTITTRTWKITLAEINWKPHMSKREENILEKSFSMGIPYLV
jgi:hypothetical protein